MTGVFYIQAWSSRRTMTSPDRPDELGSCLSIYPKRERLLICQLANVQIWTPSVRPLPRDKRQRICLLKKCLSRPFTENASRSDYWFQHSPLSVTIHCVQPVSVPCQLESASSFFLFRLTRTFLPTASTRSPSCMHVKNGSN